MPSLHSAKNPSVQWLKQTLLFVQFGIAAEPSVPDHCSCEGEVSLPEEMHFIGGVLILFAVILATLKAARNVDFGKGKADALALKPKKCSSVITSCAVVYESADCVSGWKLPINEVPLLLLSQRLTQCVLFRKKEGSGFGAATTSTGLLFFLSCTEINNS